MGKKKENGSLRLEYFPQMIKDIGCGTFKEVRRVGRLDNESSGGGLLL